MDLKNKTVQSRRRVGSEISRIGKNWRRKGGNSNSTPIFQDQSDGSRSQSSRIQVALEMVVLEAWPADLEDRRGVQQEPDKREGEEGTVARNDRPKGTRVTCTTQYRSRSALLLRDRVPYLKPLPSPPASLTATSLNSSPRDKQTLPPRD